VYSQSWHSSIETANDDRSELSRPWQRLCCAPIFAVMCGRFTRNYRGSKSTRSIADVTGGDSSRAGGVAGSNPATPTKKPLAPPDIR
jgi:hypothetical protein